MKYFLYFINVNGWDKSEVGVDLEVELEVLLEVLQEVEEEVFATGAVELPEVEF